ncbi:cyanoexosortase C [Leptolyngbya sp. FACHB-261]|uniref:cyanoexosortase C n=1 Tax=Leptolyngbya sp. FACHB-261 TaxID=2692806 RepID=UPI0016888F27|nr:cyanoexosortase C [Leptolyngbya sp. FACHB-261]MBD2101113.1 cyanoexosortase C [Leptolyngbya sp. FACHB-261]
MNWPQLDQMSWGLLRESLRTAHSKIVLGGLLIGLCYLPVWLVESFHRTEKGIATPLILVAAMFLALQELWQQRQRLSSLQAPCEDRQLGYILILASSALFPFCRFAFWPQSLLCLLVLVGIALSSWGLAFFQNYPRPVFLVVLSVHPAPDIMIEHLWRALTPPQCVERLMAWLGSYALQLIGKQATATGPYISLPKGSVLVEWGCNGFNMAVTMALTGILLGLVLRQNWRMTTGLAIVGAILALIFNVPRIMLVTIAAVEWGPEPFKFWHGAWGGQIFSSILFTIYYYAVMGILPQKSIK